MLLHAHRSPLLHSPPISARHPSGLSIEEQHSIASPSSSQQVEPLVSTVRRPEESKVSLLAPGGLFPPMSEGAAGRMRRLAETVLQRYPDVLSAPPGMAARSKGRADVALSTSESVQQSDPLPFASRSAVRSIPVSRVPASVPSSVNTVVATGSPPAPSNDVAPVLSGLLAKMDQLCSAVAALSIAQPSSASSRPRRRSSSRQTPFSVWVRRELDLSRTNASKFRHQLTLHRSSLKRLNALSKELSAAVQKATTPTDQQRANRRHLTALNDILIERGLFRSCEASYDQSVARSQYLRSLTIDDVSALSPADAASYRAVAESMADNPKDLSDDLSSVADDDQQSLDRSRDVNSDDDLFDDTIVSSSFDSSSAPVSATTAAARSTAIEKSIASPSLLDQPLRSVNEALTTGDYSRPDDCFSDSDADAQETSATSASNNASDADDPIDLSSNHDLPEPAAARSIAAARKGRPKKTISFVDDEALEFSGPSKRSTRSSVFSSSSSSSSSTSSSSTISTRTSSKSRSSLTRNESAADERLTFRRVPRDLVKLLDKLDTKIYYGSAKGEEDQPKNALHDVFRRFEAHVGQAIFNAYPESNASLRPSLVFRKYVANPLVAPLIFNAFGRHLRVPLVSGIWDDHSSFIWDVRKQALLSQVLPDRSVVLSKVQRFAWNGSETVEALRQRATILALEKLDTDPAFVNAGQRARDDERERIFRELMVEAFRSYPAAYTALLSWAACRPLDEDFDTAAFINQVRGQIRGLLGAKPVDASSAPTAAPSSSKPAPAASVPTPAPSRADRESARRSRINVAVVNVLSGETPIEQVRDRGVLAVLQKSADKGLFNKQRQCFSCRDFIGIVPGITTDTNSNHFSDKCPYRTSIAVALERLRQSYLVNSSVPPTPVAPPAATPSSKP